MPLQPLKSSTESSTCPSVFSQCRLCANPLEMNIYGHAETAEMETSVLSVELRGLFVWKGVPQFSRMVNRCADNILMAGFDHSELSVRMFFL